MSHVLSQRISIVPGLDGQNHPSPSCSASDPRSTSQELATLPLKRSHLECTTGNEWMQSRNSRYNHIHHIYIHIRIYILFILSVYISIHIDILLESYGHASEKTRTEAESKCHKWPKTNRSISLISARSPSCCQSWDTKPTM